MERHLLPMTQSSSCTRYLWVIVFIWKVNEEFPFCIVPLHMFDATSFPMQFISGPLNDSNRLKEVALRNLSENKYSVFCKIEEGVSTARRESVLQTLNEQFNIIVQNADKTMAEIYHHLIKHYSYRLLSGFSYELCPQPIRGKRGAPDKTIAGNSVI